MWLDESDPIRKQELLLKKPFVNAPGILGFAPDSHSMPFLPQLGAFITNPISRSPRLPAHNRAYLPFSGGFLLHTGLPNPGISRTVTRFKRRWAGAALPIIVHLLVETPQTLKEMARKLEGLENVLALALGLPPHCDPDMLENFMDAVSGELPAVICLSPEQIPALLQMLKSLQPAAVHLQQPRGTLPGPDGANITGRLYGPATLPTMLHTLQIMEDEGLRIIAGGGVYTHCQAQTLFDSGAMTVSLGSVLWQVNPHSIFHNQ